MKRLASSNSFRKRCWTLLLKLVIGLPAAQRQAYLIIAGSFITLHHL
jgi:hypothetical protein